MNQKIPKLHVEGPIPFTRSNLSNGLDGNLIVAGRSEHTILVVTNHRHSVALRGLVWTLIP